MYAIRSYYEVSRLVSSIASNSDEDDIRVTILTAPFLKENFNAERGLIAQFKPKEEFSEKPFGAYISLYTDGRPVIA